MIARTSRRFAILGLLLGATLAIVPVGAGGSSTTIAAGNLLSGRTPRPAIARARVSAELTSQRFIAVQATETKLVYSFSRTSKRFAFQLKSRQGSKWLTIRSVSRKGKFRGAHSMTVKTLFGVKTIKVGRYRVSLSADANRAATLGFRVMRSRSLSNAIAVSSGAGHNCVLLSGGRIDCWGYNSSGELGTGHRTVFAPYAIPTAVAVRRIATASSVSAGFLHTCALVAAGGVECWGYNRNGELGNGAITFHAPWAIAAPAPVDGITNATSVSSGGYHTCALLQGGSVTCWGFNYVGQLGNNATADSPVPIQVGGVSNATSVSAGGFHTCVLLQSGSIKCWGDNEFGQLGDGTTIDRSSPVATSAITTATAISAGYSHTCALLQGGTVECWGRNLNGQLGDGTAISSSVPVKVVGIANAVAISSGGFHTCALLSGGAIKCWGENAFGQLGDGTGVASSIPVAVHGIASAVSISAGYRDNCALVPSGKVECWGDNGVGQLGNGTTVASSIPVGVVYVP